MRQLNRIRSVISVLVLACGSTLAQAQTREIQPQFESDWSRENVQHEVDRIKSLSLPKNQPLLMEELHKAESEAQRFSVFSGQADRLKAIDISKMKVAGINALAGITERTKECPNKIVLQEIAGAIASLKSVLAEIERIPVSADAPTVPSEVSALSQMQPEDICERASEDKRYKDRVFQDGKHYFEAVDKFVSEQESALRIQIPFTARLAEAWTKRAETIRNALDGPAGIVADKLSWIVATFCLFGLAIVGVVRIFPPSVQKEFVASGQVIQFATVMVLLIVICTLSLSRAITENTLGTLLGGIAGYVLSQGVGRDAASQVRRLYRPAEEPAPSGDTSNQDKKDRPKPADTSEDKAEGDKKVPSPPLGTVGQKPSSS